jgi:Raf kinase inhibitor-like YbhB/YbcL family protein
MRDLHFGVQTSAWCSVLASVVITLSGCSGEDATPSGSAGTSTTGGTAGASGAAGGAGETGGTAGGGAGGTAGENTGGTGAGAGGEGAGGTLGGAGGTAGDGAGGAAGGGAGGAGGDGGSGGGGAFTLTSPNHTEGAMFGDKYTCAAAGFNGSLQPQLDWTAGPAGTMSYAITFIDRTLADQNNNLGYHWVIYNIPTTVMSLPEGFKMASSIGAMANSDYLGPCPNFGGGSAETHTYEFKIYALDTATITITGTGTAAVKDAETKLEANHLAVATLSGISNASPP